MMDVQKLKEGVRQQLLIEKGQLSEFREERESYVYSGILWNSYNKLIISIKGKIASLEWVLRLIGTDEKPED